MLYEAQEIRKNKHPQFYAGFYTFYVYITQNRLRFLEYQSKQII